MKFKILLTSSLFVFFLCDFSNVFASLGRDAVCPVNAYHIADTSTMDDKDKNGPSANSDDAIKGFQEDFKNREKHFDRSMDDDFFKSFNDQLQEMEQLRKKMEEQFRNFNRPFNDRLGSDFDNFLNNDLSSGDDLHLKTREDEKFLYYDIHVGEIKPNDLKVDIRNDRVTISGKVSKKESLDDKGTKGQAQYSSQFTRSFPVPEGVVMEKADVRVDENRIIITFPKDK